MLNSDTTAMRPNEMVSIIVPIYNEEDHISDCLESILAQDFPRHKLEVLLVDGMSSDQTETIVNAYAQRFHFMKVLKNHDKFVPHAMNLGIKAAKGEIILRMDAHTIYAFDYVSKCVETLEKVDADNIGGCITTIPGSDTLIAKAISLATSHAFGVGNSKFRTGGKAGYVDTVPFGAFRKGALQNLPYNNKLIRNQDIDLNSRIIRNGGKIYLNPEIRSYYLNRATLRKLWQQNFKNGEWNIYTTILNKKALSARHFAPLIFISFLFGAAVLSMFHDFFLTALALILGSYLAASIMCSATIAFGRGWRLLTILPVVFATLHISYGSGCWWGILKAQSWLRENRGSKANVGVWSWLRELRSL
jgi:glycosyltransferase involved in cell wall biosynthesis